MINNLKKRLLLRTNPFFIVIWILAILFIAFGLYSSIKNDYFANLTEIILFSIAIIIVLLSSVNYLSYFIILDGDFIKTKGFIFTFIPLNSEQHPLIINVNDISNITIVQSYKNSKKKSINISRKSLNTYYQFELKNGKKPWLKLNGFTKKQRIMILSFINDSTGSNYDYFTLLENRISR